MTRAKKLAIGATLLVALAGAGVGVQYMRNRGPSGASTLYGGEIEAKVVPEFPTQEPGRWLNGEPTTLERHKGNPVLIEAWSPG